MQSFFVQTTKIDQTARMRRLIWVFVGSKFATEGTFSHVEAHNILHFLWFMYIVPDIFVWELVVCLFFFVFCCCCFFVVLFFFLSFELRFDTFVLFTIVRFIYREKYYHTKICIYFKVLLCKLYCLAMFHLYFYCTKCAITQFHCFS